MSDELRCDRDDMHFGAFQGAGAGHLGVGLSREDEDAARADWVTCYA